MKILVVDDDLALRRLWTEVFSEAGHETLNAADAGTARELIMTHRFDVIVLDLHLGNESGLSVALLANYYNPDCNVIMITGSALFPKGELFEMVPSLSTVLRKPVAIDELLAVTEHRALAL